jgi:glutamate/tyrosine decarboxylase-like PLP-dependent enzyme
MMQLIDHFAGMARGYLADASVGPVYPEQTAITALSKLDTPLQQDPVDPSEVLSLLHEFGSPATVKTIGGRYYGFVTGGSLPAAMAAKLLTTVWDQNAALISMSPVSAVVEDITGKWLIDIFNFPPDCGFGFVTGDTMANFTALAAARHQVLQREGLDVEAKGLFNAPEITVIVGDEVHIRVLKALSMFGLGRDRIIRVAADGQGRIIPEKIPVSDKPTIICAQAGNVNTGSFDDVETICGLRGKNTWVHVDGAFGLWAAASAKKKHLTRGIELADSWATDAHKWLNVPYDSGIVFVRDKAALFAAMSASSAAYITTGAAREPFQYVPEMSRQARAIPVWAALKSLGKNGLEAMIERNCEQAALFAGLLEKHGYTILNEVVLNQALVHFGDLKQTQAAIKAIQEAGICWCGGTVWQGKPAIRISISNWSTTDEDIRRSALSVAEQVKKCQSR